MGPTTHFTDTTAVMAWDTWFRWRNGDRLCDRTIESTWWRVANAIAAQEGMQSDLWANRYVDAFSQLSLLPDERLLRLAGTGQPIPGHEPLYAALNIAAFVRTSRSSPARLDLESLADTTALAVRLLDNTLLLALPHEGARQTEVRVGLFGMADALHLLGIEYDSEQARQLAREVATTMASATLRGTIELARERGATDQNPADLTPTWQNRKIAAPLIEDALRWGIRHARLTTVAPHARLARLANNACDAVDPLLNEPLISARRSWTVVEGSRNQEVNDQSLVAQLELRAAMQPWIDTPIDYPLAVSAEPGEEEIEFSMRLAGKYGLSPLRFRRVGSDGLSPDQ